MSTAKNKVIKLAEFVDPGEVVGRMMEAVGANDIEEFASFLDVSLQAAYNYQRGGRDIPWEVVFKVIKKSDRSIDWMVFGDKVSNVSQSVTGDGNAAAAGGGASASVNHPGQVHHHSQNLNQMEREFIEGMRRYGRISDWAECFSILEKAKVK